MKKLLPLAVAGLLIVGAQASFAADPNPNTLNVVLCNDTSHVIYLQSSETGLQDILPSKLAAQQQCTTYAYKNIIPSNSLNVHFTSVDGSADLIHLTVNGVEQKDNFSAQGLLKRSTSTLQPAFHTLRVEFKA